MPKKWVSTSTFKTVSTDLSPIQITKVTAIRASQRKANVWETDSQRANKPFTTYRTRQWYGSCENLLMCKSVLLLLEKGRQQDLWPSHALRITLPHSPLVCAAYFFWDVCSYWLLYLHICLTCSTTFYQAQCSMIEKAHRSSSLILHYFARQRHDWYEKSILAYSAHCETVLSATKNGAHLEGNLVLDDLREIADIILWTNLRRVDHQLAWI